MKKTYSLLAAAAFMLTLFTAFVYTSCKKDACKGVTCNNGGTCSNGKCSCPTGFSGNNCELSSIVFQNDTYTPVNITVNGVSSIIVVGGSFSTTGTAGSAATISASTSGKSATGASVGNIITWSINKTFPTNGTILTQPLDISADNSSSIGYYYLQIINNDTIAVTGILINFGTATDSFATVNIPNDGHPYGVGYYSFNGFGLIEAHNVTGTSYTNMANWNINGIADTTNPTLILTVN